MIRKDGCEYCTSCGHLQLRLPRPAVKPLHAVGLSTRTAACINAAAVFLCTMADSGGLQPPRRMNHDQPCGPARPALPGAGFDQPFEMLGACHERVQRTLDLLQRLQTYLAEQGVDDSARQAARRTALFRCGRAPAP
jgi:hypothetical protein